MRIKSLSSPSLVTVVSSSNVTPCEDEDSPCQPSSTWITPDKFRPQTSPRGVFDFDKNMEETTLKNLGHIQRPLGGQLGDDNMGVSSAIERNLPAPPFQRQQQQEKMDYPDHLYSTPSIEKCHDTPLNLERFSTFQGSSTKSSVVSPQGQQKQLLSVKKGDMNQDPSILDHFLSWKLDDVKDFYRRFILKKRLASSLAKQRAVFRLQNELQQNRNHDDRLRHLVGEVGATLFSPLESFRLHDASVDDTEDPATLSHEADDTSRVLSDVVMPEETFQVNVCLESNEDAEVCPPILTRSMIQQLVDEGLPYCRKTDRWDRIFAIERDGDCIETMLRCCAGYKYSIIAIKTTTGHIMGGFATEVWHDCSDNRMMKSSTYFGTGESFVFATHPSEVVREDPNKELVLFRWSGENDYCQLCSAEKSEIAMGGNGGFGIVVTDNFYVGMTQSCRTFDNPPLIPNNGTDGRFEVLNFEVYGLVPYSASHAQLGASRVMRNEKKR